MKKTYGKMVIFIAIISAGVLFTACGSKSVAESKNDKPDQIEQSDNYPEWFLNPPKSADTIYAIGIASKQTMQLSLDIATSSARDEIARVVGVKVSNMVKNFMEQSGVNNESEYTEFSQTVSKQLADNTLSGSQRDKVFIDKATSPNTVYVLVRLNLADMSGAIDELVKKQASAYAKLRANKGFEDLAKELKELRGDDVETTKVTAE